MAFLKQNIHKIVFPELIEKAKGLLSKQKALIDY